MPAAVGRVGSAAMATAERRPLQLQRGQLGRDRLLQPPRRRGALPGERRRAGVVGAARRVRGGLGGNQALRAGLDRCQLSRQALGQRDEVRDRHGVLARRRAEREQPLLGPLQIPRIERHGPERRCERRLGLGERGERAVERGDGAVEQPAGFGRATLQAAKQTPQEGRRRCRPGDDLVRLADLAGEFLRPHHQRAPLRELRLLVGFGLQRRQLGDRGAEVRALRLRPGDVRLERSRGVRGLAPRGVRGGNVCAVTVEPAERIEQRAMGARLDERAVVVLPVDLDKAGADPPQQPDRHRLVVEEGAAAAVGALDTAQDQVAIDVDPRLGRDRTGGMVAAHVEHGRDIALGSPAADKAQIAAAAERERQRVEQDRLAGAGLAGEHREALRQRNVQRVDDDDVADREGGEHGAPVA